MAQYFDNQELPSNIKKLDIVLLGQKFTFYTDNGVFSKNNIDYGSRVLLESIDISDIKGNILDVGCGYGVIGITLNKLTGYETLMIDVNKRALHLAERNIKENKLKDISVLESNCYEAVNNKFNTIITNPPIRAGKKIVYEIVLKATEYLEKDGQLFIVIRKEQGAKSLLVELEKIYNVEVVNKVHGYYIIKCKNT